MEVAKFWLGPNTTWPPLRARGTAGQMTAVKQRYANSKAAEPVGGANPCQPSANDDRIRNRG